ncbi:MAG: ATP-dependent DNA helicase [Brachymonas sp.]|nr:ATP-dependent DNA helicase [Brachymonas sp.]
MQALWQQVQQVFAPGGVLAQGNAGYRPRADQLRMAQAVTRAICSNGVAVIEAGTGVGKTFAYLIPTLLSGERALVSTATKTLQDQLFARDLPYLCQLLGLPVRVALLKGRSSYLCPHRLDQARAHPAMHGAAMLHTLARIERFAQTTTSGDLAELSGLDERSPVIPIVTSTRENCLGNQCPAFKRCHVHHARRQALAADIVVINHHLFFADLAVRESGMAELLPSVHTVVFDEAHQLNAIGVQFLGKQLSTGHFFEFSRDLLAGGLEHARGLAEWPQISQQIEQGARNWRLVAAELAHGKWGWHGDVPDGISNAAQWQAALQALTAAVAAASEALDTVTELAPDLQRLHERALALLDRITLFEQPRPPETVRWMDVGNSLRLAQSPLDIADTVRHTLLRLPDNAAVPDAAGASDPAASRMHPCDADHDAAYEAEEQHGTEDDSEANTEQQPPPRRAWIFTSATLGDEPQLRWFTEPCGLLGMPTLQVASPFAYAKHASLFVPDLPPPNDPAHPSQIAQLAAEGAQLLGGRTLVLTTTLRSLRLIGDQLREQFGDEGELEILVQGESTKRRLTERFRQGSAHSSQRGCVLVASASFWEGVDIPGDALQLVVIDKLPFPPPNDPVVQARAERLKSQGRNPFMHYHLPEAAVALKQGAGRLIRHENDRGILVIGDSRLLRMGYGARLLAALPPMQRLGNYADFVRQLQTLNALRVAASDASGASDASSADGAGAKPLPESESE